MGVHKYTTNILPWFFAKFYSALNISALSSLDCSSFSWFVFFCLCRNRIHFLTSGVGGHQDLIAKKCNQTQATSSYATAQNSLQHLYFYKLSKTMGCGFQAWQKDPKQICPRATCPVQARTGTGWSLQVPPPQQILWFSIRFRIDFGESF